MDKADKDEMLIDGLEEVKGKKVIPKPKIEKVKVLKPWEKPVISFESGVEKKISP